jgi:hypothetical protein
MKVSHFPFGVGMALLLCASSARAAESPDAGGGVAEAGASPAVETAPGGDQANPPASANAPTPPPPAPLPATSSGLFEQGAVSPVAADSTVGATSALSLSGYVRGDAFVGKVPGFRTGAMKAAYGELSLAVKTAKQPYGDALAEARVRQGLQGADQQTFLDLREAYANTYVGPIDHPISLRLGRQIIVWGRADVLNPTNNLTPFDLRIRSPIEDDRRIGNVGARLFVAWAPVRLEGVWLPLYAPSELPPVGLPQFVSFGAPRFPNPELKNGLVAGRIHLEVPAFEMSVSYLHGYAPLPGFTLSGLTFDAMSPQVQVARTAYNHHVVGLDFSTALGEVVAIRGEAAYRRPTAYQSRLYAPRPDLQYVLGVDRAFGPVTVIAQYVGRYVFDWQRENGPDQPLTPAALMFDNPSPFIQDAVATAINLQLARTNQILFSQTARLQHLASARVEWLAAHETLSLSALGIVNVTTKEWLASPKIGYRVSDTLTAYLGAEIFVGPDGTLFGLIDEVLSAGYTELRVIF